jgi:hypothetical protein
MAVGNARDKKEEKCKAAKRYKTIANEGRRSRCCSLPVSSVVNDQSRVKKV